MYHAMFSARQVFPCAIRSPTSRTVYLCQLPSLVKASSRFDGVEQVPPILFKLISMTSNLLSINYGDTSVASSIPRSAQRSMGMGSDGVAVTDLLVTNNPGCPVPEAATAAAATPMS